MKVSMQRNRMAAGGDAEIGGIRVAFNFDATKVPLYSPVEERIPPIPLSVPRSALVKE